MDETNIKKYSESYFMFKKLISEIFIIPLILYILAIAFIIHVTIFNQPLKTQINLYSAKKRKILFLILIFLYICNIISLIKVTNLETSENTVSSSFTLIILLFYIILIMAVLLTIYFIDEKNKKQIKLDKRNPLEWFIILNIIYFLLDLVNEIVYGYFTFLTPFTFCFCIYFQVFVYKYPDDNYKIFLSKGFKYIELNEFDKELINKKIQSIKINEQKYKLNKNKYYIPMTYMNGTTNMLGDENPKNNSSNLNDENLSNNNDISKDNNNNKINQQINELYNPNNSEYLKNSYEGALNIQVAFQSNFSIDYGTYYNYNKTKKMILDNQNNNDSIKNRLSGYTFEGEENDSDDHLDIANFYTSIIFCFNVSATSSFYITNKRLRKSLEEFFKLDILLENEFTEENYDSSLIKTLPRLNIKKCFDELSKNIKNGININNSSNNSDILLECIQNTKNVCEKYLKEITSNKNFIIPEVLLFLEIRDQNVFQIYFNINNQLRKKVNNIFSRFSVKCDNISNNNFYLSTNCNYFTSHNDYNMNIILKVLRGDYYSPNLTNKNNKENNEYYLLVRITYGESNKYIKKKFGETIYVLQEFNKLLDNHHYNFSGKKMVIKNKEIFSKINKYYMEFFKFLGKLKGQAGSGATQSFNLSKNNTLIEFFKKYPDEIENNDDDLISNLIIIIESILNIIINHYLDQIPNSNQIVHEYFIDCIDDYWDVEKLKKYLKHNKNLLALFQKEIKEKNINNIFVLDKNYLYININYNTTIFYELSFKITTYSNFIQLDKKYIFEEIKNYIDLMNVELSLGLVWPEKCFTEKQEFLDDINNNIHIIRLNYMSKYLNKIFNANKIFNTNNWKKIFYDDKSYHDVIEIKFKELNHNYHKKNPIIKKNSDETNSFYLNDNNIKMSDKSFNLKNSFKNKEDNSEDIKNENKFSIEDPNSEKANESDISINNSEEKQSSMESITSHFSKNSKLKNLLDV